MIELNNLLKSLDIDKDYHNKIFDSMIFENLYTKIEVLLENEDVWLNTEALSTLFNIDRSGIARHINNIYKDEELEKRSTCSKNGTCG